MHDPYVLKDTSSYEKMFAGFLVTAIQLHEAQCYGKPPWHSCYVTHLVTQGVTGLIPGFSSLLAETHLHMTLAVVEYQTRNQSIKAIENDWQIYVAKQ